MTATPELASFERDDLHREIVRTQSNRLEQTQAYDKTGRLLEQTLSHLDKTTAYVNRRQYRYDPVGNDGGDVGRAGGRGRVQGADASAGGKSHAGYAARTMGSEGRKTGARGKVDWLRGGDCGCWVGCLPCGR